MPRCGCPFLQCIYGTFQIPCRSVACQRPQVEHAQRLVVLRIRRQDPAQQVGAPGLDAITDERVVHHHQGLGILPSTSSGRSDGSKLNSDLNSPRTHPDACPMPIPALGPPPRGPPMSPRTPTSDCHRASAAGGSDRRPRSASAGRMIHPAGSAVGKSGCS